MTLWAITSLLPGLLHVGVGGYVLYKRPRQPMNIVFSLFAFSLALWCLTEFAHRLDVTPESAYFWIMLGGPGWCFSPALCLHFTLLFAKKKHVLQNWRAILLLYGPPFVLLTLFYGTDIIYHHIPVAMYFGYTLRPGELAWLCVFYYLLMYVLGAYYLLSVARRGGRVEKPQAKVVLLGIGLSLTLSLLTNVIAPVMKMPLPELATLFTALTMVAVFYAIIRYQLFIIEPSPEALHPTPQKYPLDRGRFLIVDDDMDKGYRIFYDQVTHGAHGLSLTKFPPEKIRKKYKIARSPLIWVTFKDGVNTVSPRELNRLEAGVTEFLLKAGDACVLIDCFRELELVNGFEKAAGSIAKISERCKTAGARLILLLPPVDEFDTRKHRIEMATGR